MKTKTSYLFLATILLAGSLSQIVSDLYLPSLPAMALAFKVPVNWVQWSIAIYVWGASLSQLIYGPISDGLGRKPPLVFALSFLLTGSIICWLSPSINWLILGRCLQGIGGGGCMVLMRAIIRDQYSGAELARLGSYMGVIFVSIVACAPLLGGYIHHIWGWRANFGLLTLFTVIVFLLGVFKLPETNQHKQRHHLRLRQWWANGLLLIKNPLFASASVIVFTTYAGTIAWLTVGPVLLQMQAGLTPVQFGWAAFFSGLTFIAGSLTNGKIVGRCGIARMLALGLTLMSIGGVSMLALTYIVQPINAVIIVLPVIFFTVGSGFIYANAYAVALTPFHKIAGIAASLYGCMQMLGGAVSSAVLAHLHEETQIPLALTFCLCLTIAWIAFYQIKDKL